MTRRTAVIVPAGTDLNRGDQALFWEAEALLRDGRLVDDVVMIGDCVPAERGEAQAAQSQARGYNVTPSLLDAPRRGRHRSGDKIEDTIVSLMLLVLHSLTGFLRGSGILLFARQPRVAQLFMTARQRRTYETIRSSALVVVKGGGFLHAHGGIRAPYYIWFQLFYLRLAHRLGKPVVILPNSFGPFDGWTVRGQVRRVLSKSRGVAARESISAAALEQLLETPVPVLPDMGYFLEAAPRAVGEEICRRAGVPLGRQPCVAFTVRPWRFPGSRSPGDRFSRYVTAMARLVRHVFEQGYHPVLVSHVLGPGAHEDDRLALDELVTHLGGLSYTRIDHPGDCRDLKSIYGCMDYLVGTRFHSVIFAQGAGVPCLAIAYGGNKGTGIMRDWGLGEYVVSIDSVEPETLCRKFDLLVANAGTVRATMAEWRVRAAMQRREIAAMLSSALSAG